jgi:hypothetical protein
MRFINIKSALIAATLAVGTLTAASIATVAPAEAHGFGFGHGFGHGWGHGFGRGFGGIYIYGGGDDDGGCYVKHYYDEDGYEHFRKVCY